MVEIDLSRGDFEQYDKDVRIQQLFSDIRRYFEEHMLQPTKIIGFGDSTLNIINTISDVNADKIVLGLAYEYSTAYNHNVQKKIYHDDITYLSISPMSCPTPEFETADEVFYYYEQGKEFLIDSLFKSNYNYVFVSTIGGFGGFLLGNFVEYLHAYKPKILDNSIAFLQLPFSFEKRTEKTEELLRKITDTITFGEYNPNKDASDNLIQTFADVDRVMANMIKRYLIQNECMN